MQINNKIILLLTVAFVSLSCGASFSATTLLAPENGAVFDTTTPTLEWSDVGATRYRLVVSEDELFRDLDDTDDIETACKENTTCQTIRSSYTNYKIGSDQIYAGEPIHLDAGKTYYWKIRDTDSTEWSSVFHFTISLSKPTLTNPANAAEDISVTAQNFKWSSVDGATKYRILVLEKGYYDEMVSDGMNSYCKNSAVCFTDTTTSTSYSGFNLKDGTSYYWMVWAGCSNDLADSEFGAAYFVTGTSSVDNKPPVFVSGSATPSSIATGDQITFQSMWDDPEKKSIVDVQVRFRKQGTTNWQIKDLTDKGNYTFSASYVISGEAGTYEYQFRASDADTPSGDRTNTTNWLSDGTFEVQDGPQPFGAPNLISPTNGAAGISSESVTFKWGTVTDATNYRIVISKDSSVGGFDDSTRACDPNICQTAATPDTSNVFKLEPATIYYWHVRANSSTLGIASDWSATYSFTTKKEQVTLTVTTSGTERGTVTSTPKGINCGTDCSASYIADTVVTLTVSAKDGYVFRSWSDWCSGTEESCEVTMDNTKNVSAVFADKNAKSFKVWLDFNGNGDYDQGEELKETTVSYRVIAKNKKPVDIELREMMTDEQGVIDLVVYNDTDSIYIESVFGTEAVADDLIKGLSDNENPFSEVDNIRYEFVMASDIRKDKENKEKDAEVDHPSVIGDYHNFPGKYKTFDSELKKDSEGNILIKLGHPKWQWNLTICFEDPHIEEYYEKIESALGNDNIVRAGDPDYIYRDYADYLYNYTDGYSLVKNIIMVKGGYKELGNIWNNLCDIRVKSTAWCRASDSLGGSTSRGHINMGRTIQSKTLFYEPERQGDDDWRWYKTLAHESGHYFFSFRDEYMSRRGYINYLNGLPVTWPYRWENNGGAGETNQFPENYGVMEHQNKSHELSDSADYLSVSEVQKCWMKPELSEQENSVIEDIVVDFTNKAHGLDIKKYLQVLYKFDSEDGEKYLQNIINDENDEAIKAIRDYIEYDKRVSMQYYYREKSTWWTFKEELDELITTYLSTIYLSRISDHSDNEHALEKFTSTVFNSFIVPPNASKKNEELVGEVYKGLTGKPCDHIFSKPVNVEYNKRPGPNEMLNNQLNIIDWEPVDNEEESILGATIQICKEINSGRCNPFTSKDDSKPISITLETMREDSQGYSSIRSTDQGTVKRTIGELYITSFVKKPNDIKQWLVVNYVVDDDALSEIAECFVDIGDFNDIENQEDRKIKIDVSQLTKELPKLTNEGKTTESCNTEAQQTEFFAQYISSDTAPYVASQKKSNKKQDNPEGIIVNIKPDSFDEGKIQVAFLAKEKFFVQEHEGSAVLRQQGFEGYIDFSLQGNSYIGTSDYMADTGIADVGFQTDLGVMRAYNRFEIFSSDAGYASGFPAPGGELLMSAPEGSFEGSGKFIITSSSITPPSNGKLKQVGNVGRLPLERC